MSRAKKYAWPIVFRTVIRVALLAAVLLVPARAFAQAPATSANYRARILGVFDSQSGEPIEGAGVTDLFAKLTAATTKTGTVSLAFLPEGASMLRIQKIGFKPVTQVVEISPVDTIAITVLMEATAQILPTVVSKDSANVFVSPRMRDFEDRRKTGMGRFITEAELRKNDNRSLTNVVRQSGAAVSCTRRTPIQCFAVNPRSGGSGCSLDVYYDGVLVNDDNRDLETIPTSQIGAVEIYASTATVPAMYNKTGKGCGVMLLWSRMR
ncbi:MAG: carboxypeptidase-like regulatory domain-containing protein [Gemmatimonadaceae bacterium]